MLRIKPRIPTFLRTIIADERHADEFKRCLVLNMDFTGGSGQLLPSEI